MVFRFFKAKWTNTLIKIVVTMALFALLYYEVFHREDAQQLSTLLLEQWQTSDWWWALITILLLPLNWLLEAIKWKTLLSAFCQIPLLRALNGILAGVSLSLFTPNRIGDYGGRVLAVPAQYNWYAILATMLGSYAQLLIILGGGLWGIMYFLNHYSDWPIVIYNGFWWLAFVLLGFAFFFFFNISLLAKLIKSLRLPRRFNFLIHYLYKVRHFNREVLSSALLIAAFRYLIYCFQYFCMIKFVGIEVSLVGAFSCITAIFFIQSSVPLPPLAGLLARGEAALILWGHFSDNKMGILAATFGLFIINLVFPALLGLGIIVKINVLKSLGYEHQAIEDRLNIHNGNSSDGIHASK